MTVIQLDITPADDPLGTPLVTLTDEDVATFEMREAENQLGSGSFTIRRDHAAATATNLATGNYVKVTIPAIDADPVFGFFLDDHDDLILAQGEEGAETLKREGPGTLSIVGRGRLLDQHYATAPPASDDRGSPNEIIGYWRWEHKAYGEIFKRFLEEGQTQPGTPLVDVTTDFDRDTDSAGVAWPSITRDVRFAIGTDGLQLLDAFAATGEVYIRADADLMIHAYQSRGTDRTSGSFGSGKVRLVKGVNIQTELTREGEGQRQATHAIVIGADNVYRQVVSPSYVSGPGRWITVNYEETNDTDLLDKVGIEALARGDADQQVLTLEIRAGNVPLSGEYLPYRHFNTGDLITLHTGSSSTDYNETSQIVAAFSIALRDASRDETDEIAARSLIVTVELGGGPKTSLVDMTIQPASCCPSLGQFVPGSPTAGTLAPVGGIFIQSDLHITADSFGDASKASRLVLSDTSFVAGPIGGWQDTGHVGANPWTDQGSESADSTAGDGTGFIVGSSGHTPVWGPFTSLPTNTPLYVFAQYYSAVGGTQYTNGGSSFDFFGTPPAGYTIVSFASPGASGGVGTIFPVGGFTIIPPGGSVTSLPAIGQSTEEAIAGTTAGGTYTTNYPYIPNSIHVTVGGIPVVATEVDPTLGTFTLPVDATGQVVIVHYAVYSSTGTGETNPQPSAALQYIPDVFLATDTPAYGEALVWRPTGRVWESLSGSGGILPWYDVKIDGTAVGDGVTDDTTAIQDAIDAATASGTQSATLYFPPGTYLIGGALQDTGAFNGQLLLPNVSMSDPGITVTFQGAARPSFTSPGTEDGATSVIKSSLTGASGTAAVISAGNGSYPGTKNNVSVVVRDMISIAPDNPTMTFWNLAASQAGAIDGLLITTVGAGTGVYVQPTHSNSYGIKLPQVRNSSYGHVDGLMVGLHYTGVLQGELSINRGLIFGLCMVAVEFPGPGEHESLIVDIHATGCPTVFKATGLHYCDILAYDFETTTGPAWSDIVYDLDDASNYLHGHTRYFGYPNPPTHTFTKNGGTNFSSAVIGALAAPSGTVTSVDLTMPAGFSVSGNPITTSGTLVVTGGPSGIDHQHIMNLWFSGDGSTTAFTLPAGAFDANSIRVWVSGTLTDVTLSGALLDTMTFGSAPASATNNIVVDLVAAAA